MAESEGPARSQRERAAGRRFPAWAGALWILAAACFGYQSLVQLGYTGDYVMPDLGSATVNALGAVSGLAIGGWLIRRASSSALAISVAYAGTVLVAGGYQLTQGIGGWTLASAVVAAGLAGLFSVLALGRLGRSPGKAVRGAIRGPESAGRGPAIFERLHGLSATQMAAILATAGCLTVYVLTMFPGVSFGDSAEFQRIPYALEIPHPTGYPVHVLVGKLFSLLPLDTVAWRANLLSSVAAASAVGTSVLIMTRLAVRPVVAAASAAAGGLGALIWSEATVAEANVLELLLVMLLLHRALVWRDGRRPRDLQIGGLLLGVAVLTHPTAVPFGALILGYALWAGRAVLAARPMLLVRGALAFLLGFALVLYIPLRGLLGPSDLYHSLATWDGFFHWITGQQVHVTDVWSIAGIGRFVGGLIGAMVTVADRSTWIFVALAAVGCAALWTRDRAFAALSTATVLLSIYVYLNFFPTHERYLLIAALICAMWIGIGVEWALTRAGTRWSQLAWALVALPVLVTTTFWPVEDQSGNHDGETFVATVFAKLPTGAAVVSYWDALQPMAYEHCVEGTRRDIVLLSPFDPEFQACDRDVDLQDLVRTRATYGLFYDQAYLDILGRDFQLDQPVPLAVPFGGRSADTPGYLVRLRPKASGSGG